MLLESGQEAMEGQNQPAGFDHHIINMVVSGNWHEVLVSLTRDMNPWDIDLVELNARFTDYVKCTAKMDLRVPAKVLLAAAILYRLKADTIHSEYEEPEVPEFLDEPEESVPGLPRLSDIPPLRVPLIRKPRRKLSLNDLVHALDKAITVKTRREVRQKFQITLNGEDITKRIEEVYENINMFLAKSDSARFSQLIRKDTAEERISAFRSILHLSNEGRLECAQNELFGEIYLTLPEEVGAP